MPHVCRAHVDLAQSVLSQFQMAAMYEAIVSRLERLLGERGGPTNKLKDFAEDAGLPASAARTSQLTSLASIRS
jgi:hypothetical protein